MKKYMLLLLLLSCTSSFLVVAAEEAEQTDAVNEWRVRGSSNSYSRFSDAFFVVMQSYSKMLRSDQNSLSIAAGNEISCSGVDKMVYPAGHLYKVRRSQDNVLSIPGLNETISESGFDDWATKEANAIRLYDGTNSGCMYLFNQTKAIAAIVKNASDLNKIPNPLFNESDGDEAFLFKGRLLDGKGLSLIDD